MTAPLPRVLSRSTDERSGRIVYVVESEPHDGRDGAPTHARVSREPVFGGVYCFACRSEHCIHAAAVASHAKAHAAALVSIVPPAGGPVTPRSVP